MYDENEHQYKTIEAKDVVLKDNYKFFITNPILVFLCRTMVYITAFFVFFYKYFFIGFRKYGSKNIKKVKGGAIVVANHIHPMDAFLIPCSLLKYRFYIISLQSNFGLPFFGKYIRTVLAVPIPLKKEQLKRFSREFITSVNKGNKVLIYPEQALIPYCKHIRPFKKGAFRFAIQSGKPIIPMVWTYHKPKSLLKRHFKKNPCLHLNILEPYYPTIEATNYETILKAETEVNKIMSDFFLSHSEYIDELDS